MVAVTTFPPREITPFAGLKLGHSRLCIRTSLLNVRLLTIWLDLLVLLRFAGISEKGHGEKINVYKFIK